MVTKAPQQVWLREDTSAGTLKLYGSRRDVVQTQIERAGRVLVSFEGVA